MEASSSSNTAVPMPESVVDNMTKIGSVSVGGRKSEDIVAHLVEVSSDEVSSGDLSMVEDGDLEDYEEEEDSDEESDEEDFDEEEEEENRERARVLEDMWKLKKLASFFQHPENPVEVDGYSAGRSYFSRASAIEVVSEDEDEECARALADAKALKELASDYLHPELPLDVDSTACARNYFSQPWATEQETFGGAEERARIVEEGKVLQKLAATYRHPEAPVEMEGGFSVGRNYFERAFAIEQTDEADDEERARILKDMQALKGLAADYMHPEVPLQVDAASFGRNYFQRPSGHEHEEEEDVDEREIILEEMKELKLAAMDYQHPESFRQLDVDPTVYGRNYFDRPSADEQDSEERDLILADMRALKKLAVDYKHPEEPVEAESTMFGRNYFQGASAPEQEFDMEEKAGVIADIQMLKKLASDYKHPEKSLEVDPNACGRNYFNRASAPEQDDDEYADEREVILEEMKELKEAAVAFKHPESLATKFDASASGRNFFDRPSAPMQDADADEREQILKEMSSLKKLAVGYMHPELPLDVDGTACARNYFNRPSAPEQDDETSEREEILKDAMMLKQKASDYMHPEAPLSLDGTAFARNYFTRPSAPEQDDEASEREEILKDAMMLKQKASDFMHPEAPLAVDPIAFGRNYFGRASGPEAESAGDAEERSRIASEVKLLKQKATDFMHPENPVDVAPVAFGRNFFTRPSAEDTDDSEDEAERELVLKEAAELKKLASDYMHPEKRLTVDPCAFGRNYFGRASAVEQEDEEADEEREAILGELAQLKKAAVDYLHPEMPVAVDPTAFARTFFGRASAIDQETYGQAEERARVLAQSTVLKKVATDYAHPELPVATTDPAVFGRGYFSRPSAPDGETADDAEERARVLSDASALKQVAVDFAHPEVPLEVTDPAACGRNYFSRASAAGAGEQIQTTGYSNVKSSAEVEEHSHSHYDDYGHFDMDEEIFYDMRQSIVLPLPGESGGLGPKIQSSKISSEEEGELSRSPSSVMLFTGALDDAEHPPLPTMG